MELNRQSGPLLLSLLDPTAEGSGEVLNDYFEEHGQRRVVSAGFDIFEMPARFAFILDELLPVKVAKMLACDFAEHALDKAQLDEGALMGAEDLLEMQRKVLIESQMSDAQSNSAVQQKLIETANAMFGGAWKADTSPQSRAAWAVWAIVMGKPSNVAVSAQAVDDDEHDWQMGHLVAEITRISNDESNEMAK